MRSNRRRWLMVLATIALLWQSMGEALAASVRCCPELQACCLVPSLKASCASCVPGPVAAGGFRPSLAAPAALERTERDQRPGRGRVVHEIWRPPMVAANATSNQPNPTP
jgi:hypothetical protein